MIQNNDTDWLRKFGERVDSIEDVPAEGAFEAIMASAAGVRRRARARRTVALVAGLAAAAAVSAIFLLPEGAVKAPQNEGHLVAENLAVEAAPTTPAPLVAAVTSATETSATAPSSSLNATPASEPEPAVGTNPAEAVAGPETSPARQTAPQTVVPDNAAALNRYIASLDDEKPRRRRLHLSLHANSFMTSDNEESTLIKMIIPSYSNSSSDIFGTSSSGDIQILPTGRQSYSIDYGNGMPVITQVTDKYGLPLVIEKGKVEERIVPVGRSFHAPVSAGITLSYDLTPRFAVESGISFTLLSSILTLGNSPLISVDSYYAGIPLSVKADIYETNNSDFYLRSGGMAEKCIASTESGGFKPDKLLWSAFGYAGYQYRINGFSSIYFEPGVSYHFDSDNTGYTIYENNPCLFSLQAGLRFRL